MEPSLRQGVDLATFVLKARSHTKPNALLLSKLLLEFLLQIVPCHVQLEHLFQVLVLFFGCVLLQCFFVLFLFDGLYN